MGAGIPLTSCTNAEQAHKYFQRAKFQLNKEYTTQDGSVAVIVVCIPDNSGFVECLCFKVLANQVTNCILHQSSVVLGFAEQQNAASRHSRNEVLS